MKNTVAFPMIVISFAVGAFLPYLNLNGKIEEMNSKMDNMMEYVNSTNDRIDYIYLADYSEKNAYAMQGFANSAWDPKLHTLTVVDMEEDRQITQKVKSTN